MATGPQAFYRLWQEERILRKLFEELSNEDIAAVRLASSACCNLVTKRLFARTHLTFTANTFTKPSRVQALSRIGHHIEHLTFYMPHSDATFLPPLIHPESGREINFLYTPHTSMASALTRPKYGNTELGEILTQQYPPLFHAATNVPSFINALKHVPNLRHLTVRCPGQDPKERYRRDIVDYALMSLRISLERVPLKRLSRLTLSAVHPSAFLYLRHCPSFGSVPSASRRWRQIRRLTISVEAWDFYNPASPGLDQLKVIEDYVRAFSAHLERFSFSWIGRKGPCPIALAGDPLFAPPRSSRKLFNEVTSPMSPLPAIPHRPPVRFRRLRHLEIRNATMNVPQVSALVDAHRHTVRQFDFENVALIRGGSWDDALAPLMEDAAASGSNGGRAGPVWQRISTGGSDLVSGRGSVVVVDDPLVAAQAPAGLYTTESPPDSAIDLRSPSAAVEAASRELLEVDLDRWFAGQEEAAEAEAAKKAHGPLPEDVDEGFGGSGEGEDDDEEDNGNGDQQNHAADMDDDIASDIAAAREASLAFNTTLKTRRLLRKRSHHHHHDHHGRSSSHHRRHHSDDSDHHRRHRHDDRHCHGEDRHRNHRREQRGQLHHSRSRSYSPAARYRTASEHRLAAARRDAERRKRRHDERHHGDRHQDEQRPPSRRQHRRHHDEEMTQMPSMPMPGSFPVLLPPVKLDLDAVRIVSPPADEIVLPSDDESRARHHASPGYQPKQQQQRENGRLRHVASHGSPRSAAAPSTPPVGGRPVTPPQQLRSRSNSTPIESIAEEGDHQENQRQRHSPRSPQPASSLPQWASLTPPPLSITPRPQQQQRQPRHSPSSSFSSSTSKASKASDDDPFVDKPVASGSNNISAPILTNPPPVLLQPAVYDPTRTRAATQQQTGGGSGSAAPMTTAIANEISSVQRNLELEAAHQRMAEDVAARKTALRKAREAVLGRLRLRDEFRGAVPFGSSSDVGARTDREREREREKTLKEGFGSGGVGMGMRIREGLLGAFGGSGSGGGRNDSAVDIVLPDHIPAMAAGCVAGHHGLLGKSSAYRSVDSTTALVPLIFARS